MAKGSCKCKKVECEECPEWIFTFADLVMLMMGFFVILWVLKPAPGKPSTVDIDEKWLEVVAKIREAFNYLPDPTSKDPVDMHMLMKKIEEMEPLKGPGKGGKTEKTPRGAEGSNPEVESVRPGKHAIIGTRILFEPGKDAFAADEGTTSRLNDIVKIIAGHRQIFLVKGHTAQDDFPEGATAEQKMSLSVRRAQRVADYLTSHGVEPEILRVQGCSTFEPVVLRAYSDDVRTMNRRVEIEGTDSPVTDRQDAVKTTRVPPPDLEGKTAGASTDSAVEPK